MDTTSLQAGSSDLENHETTNRSDLENNETTNSTNVDVGGNSGTQINMKRKREEQENHETTNSNNVDVGGNSGTQIDRKRKREEHETCSEGRMENTTSETGSSDHHETTNSANVDVERKKCPEGNSKLIKDDCEKILSSKSQEAEIPDDCEKILSSKSQDDCEKFIKRLQEAEIPDSEKVYCPQAPSSSSSHPFPATECQNCHRLFCFQLSDPDAELNLLAQNQKWKQCPSCEHMIERTGGCDQITCRCGFKFCYNCGKSGRCGFFCEEEDYDEEDAEDEEE